MYDYSVQQCELIKFDEMSVDNYGNYGRSKVLYPESPTFSSTFYYRQLTPPIPESSTFLNPLLTLPMLYIKSSTLLTVGLSIVVSCVVGLSKMIDRWKDDFMLLNAPHTPTTDTVNNNN